MSLCVSPLSLACTPFALASDSFTRCFGTIAGLSGSRRGLQLHRKNRAVSRCAEVPSRSRRRENTPGRRHRVNALGDCCLWLRGMTRTPGNVGCMRKHNLSLILVALLVLLSHFGIVPADVGWLHPWVVAFLLDLRRRSSVPSRTTGSSRSSKGNPTGTRGPTGRPPSLR